jgi:hypothetical protein
MIFLSLVRGTAPELGVRFFRPDSSDIAGFRAAGAAALTLSLTSIKIMKN